MKLLPVSFLSLTALAAQPYSSWMADSIIATNVPKTRFYTEAVFYRGIEYVYNATRDVSYTTYLTSQLDPMIADNGTFTTWNPASRQLDSVRIGETLLLLWAATGIDKYRAATTFLRAELGAQRRTDEGAFWHKDPEYPDQQWLDGLFMADVFYAHWTALFGGDDAANQTGAWDDIVLQFDLMERHCRDARTGLLFHGYDQSRRKVWADPVTGASPRVWSRAVGWYFMALLDVLEWLPREHEGYPRLVRYFASLAPALRETWDEEGGGWWLVMDGGYPGKEGNYIESSGTAMFIAGFLKGMRMGYLDRQSYEQFALWAYDAMVDRFVGRNATSGGLTWEGTVKVGSLSGNGTFEYYIDQVVVQNHLNGVGPFIYASAEVELLRGHKSD